MRNLIIKSALFGLLAAALIVITGCTTAESYARPDYDFSKIEKVAVIDVIGKIRDEGMKNQISDFFVLELIKKGYSPVERAQVQSLLKEQKFQQSSITSEADAVKAGKILNVPMVMVVNVPKISDDEISFTAKMIDVETGDIVWVGTGTGSANRLFSTILGATGGAIAGGAIAGEGSRTGGAVAGAVIGGSAGHLLSPKQAQKAQEIIKKICNTMPPRFKTKPAGKFLGIF